MTDRSDDFVIGRALLGCARAAIAQALGLPAGQQRENDDHASLAAHGASFVTLTRDGSLRGCIGTLEAHRSLAADVRANAVAAALRDPRFAPMRARELVGTVIEVSVLGAAQPLAARAEADVLAQVRPREDGLVIAWRGQRATFLPQVWEALPDPVDFLRELKRKARLPADFWASDLQVSTYRVEKWSERDPAFAGQQAAT